METSSKTFITVETIVDAPIAKVWDYWTNPIHIVKWNNASDDWHTPISENDVQVGGRFLSRIEAKDGSFGFDFTGTYINISHQALIEYTMDDNRHAKITFAEENGKTKVVETFEAETENSVELQKGGWQAILDNFKKYVEAS